MKLKPNFNLDELNRKAEKRILLSTNWSYGIYSIVQVFDDPNPQYWITNLPEAYTEAFLRRKNLTMGENGKDMKKLNLESEL